MHCVQNLLTFVAVRLFLPKGATRLPRAVANALYQIVAMVAQQFEGYIFTVNIDEVRSRCHDNNEACVTAAAKHCMLLRTIWLVSLPATCS